MIKDTLEAARDYLRDKRWGTIDYMEGSDVYADLRRHADQLDAALRAMDEALLKSCNEGRDNHLPEGCPRAIAAEQRAERLAGLLDIVLTRACEWNHSTHPVPAEDTMNAIWTEVCIPWMTRDAEAS